MKIYSVCLILCFTVFCTCEKRQTVNYLAVLDKNSTHKFDIYVRREILFHILSKINETNHIQIVSSRDCETKLNNTILRCQQCLAKDCSGSNYVYYQNALKKLIPVIFNPALDVSKFIDQMGSSLKTAIQIMGEESGLFLKDLAQISKFLGSGLTTGGSTEFSKISSGLEFLGDKLTSLSKDLVLKPLEKLPDLKHVDILLGAGSGFLDLLNQVGSGFTSIGDALKGFGNTIVGGITDAGKGIQQTGNKIGNAVDNIFHSIFGKRNLHIRQECVHHCTDCDRVDLNSHETTTVLALVCGEEIIYNQRNTLNQMKYLQGIYNNTLENVLITKIEYDPGSIKTASRIAFTTSFMTYTVNGIVDKFRSESEFEISNLKTSAKAVADQIWRLMN